MKYSYCLCLVSAHRDIPGNEVAAKQARISLYAYKFEAISENLFWQLAQEENDDAWN